MKTSIDISFIYLVGIIFTMCKTSKESITQQRAAPTQFRPSQQGPPSFRRRSNDPTKDAVKENTYTINLDVNDCDIDIQKKANSKSNYTEQINRPEGIRTITINSIANHKVGAFPNQGNPNRIFEQDWTFSIPLNPKIAGRKTTGRRYDTEFLFSGVTIDPFTAEFFITSNGNINREWNITTLTSTEDLGLDCNNAHVQPSGKYHYHGTPTGYLAEIHYLGDKMLKIGYTADGFPIYYKYAYDQNGKLTEHKSGYRLKQRKRPGDGKDTLGGYYNGRYFNDHEYSAEISPLDECNGRWGKTPERRNEYFYVITDNFPSAPLCFSGKPSEDLRK